MEIRDVLFTKIRNESYIFEVKSKQEGIIAGIERAKNIINALDVNITFLSKNGEKITEGSLIISGIAHPLDIISLEESILGIIGKASGIATAAQKALDASNGKIKVVCGAWKKVDPEIRQFLREAAEVTKISTRITKPPFVYLDKNYIRLLGGITSAINEAKKIKKYKIVIQLHNIFKSVEEEAIEAISAGADVFMIDTGNKMDAKNVVKIIKQKSKENAVIAFSGGISLEEIPYLAQIGINVIDIGRAIVDAPMIDFSLDVKA